MASMLRTGLVSLAPSGLLGGLCKVAPKRRNALVTQVACITSREQRIGRPPKPPPYEWGSDLGSKWVYAMDPMGERFDDNTKVIVVEGLPGVGKDKLARRLAEELEMTYWKPPNFDDIWINTYGFDLRSLNPKLPEDAQFYDVRTFLENPKGRNTAAMQLSMFVLRCRQYVNCLVDVLSTGNGAVVQRCPYSDINFVHAMLKNGYISTGAFSYYKKAISAILEDLMRPHLILYLDAPISTIKNNIKKRNIPYEANSPALTEKYLQDLDSAYKEYLRGCSKQSHLLIYDWTTEGDAEVVIEDIERLDFEGGRLESERTDKFKDWKFDNIYDAKMKRKSLAMASSYQHMFSTINIAKTDIPEMLISGQDAVILDTLLSEVTSEAYSPGFHPKFDKGLWFKTKPTYEDLNPHEKVIKEE